VVSFLLAKGAEPNQIESFGCTPLHYAASAGSYPTVDVLMSYNADVNLADNTGGTPLHYACRQGNVDIVKLLLTKVNPNLNDLRTC